MDKIRELFLDSFLEQNNITKEQWICDTYDQYADIMTEQEFYRTKYMEPCYVNTPDYDMWSNYVYERLGPSLAMSNDELLIKWINKIQGIINADTIKDNPWCLKLTYDDSFDINCKELQHLLNMYNYSLVYHNKVKHTIQLEANKPELVKYNKRYLYHVTNSTSWKKIQKIGLIPKSKEYIDGFKHLNHPQRIYLFDGDADPNYIYKFGKGFNFAKGLPENDIVILRVYDIGSKIQLYKDPMTEIIGNNVPYFTLEPIRSRYIEKVNFEIREDIDLSNTRIVIDQPVETFHLYTN